MNKDESDIDLSVVLFLEEDDAPAVVASSWLRFRDKMCYWPSHIKSECKREKLVHSSAVPDPEEGWELCPVRVLQKGIKDPLIARNKAKLAETTSDIDTQPLKRPKKPVQKFSPEESSDEENQRSDKKDRKRPKKSVSSKPSQDSDKNERQEPAPTIYASPANVSGTIPFNASNASSNFELRPNASSENFSKSPDTPNLYGSNSNAHFVGASSNFESHFAFARTDGEARDPSLSSGRDFSRTLQYLKSAVESNGRLLEKILEKVEKLEIGATSESAVKTNSAESNIDEMLPCKTYEDVLKVEETIIKSTDALNKLMKILQLVGGSETKTLIHNMVRKIIVDEVAQLFSFKGAIAGKKSFQSLKMYKVLKGVIQKQKSDATDDYLKDVLGDWLTQAKFRVKRRLDRAAKKLNNPGMMNNPGIDATSQVTDEPEEPVVSLENIGPEENLDENI